MGTEIEPEPTFHGLASTWSGQQEAAIHSSTSSCQLVEQRLCGFEIGGV
jgi:hypothetical protein